MKLRDILNEITLTFKDEMVGHSHGQADMSLKAYHGNKVVGKLDYSEYEKRPSVKMLEVPIEWRRKGIGTQLLKKLQNLYPDTEIDLGYASDDGSALLKTVNRKFIPNKRYEKLSKQLANLKREEDRLISLSNNGDYSESHKFNDLRDKIYDIEDELQDLDKGKWIII